MRLVWEQRSLFTERSTDDKKEHLGEESERFLLKGSGDYRSPSAACRDVTLHRDGEEKGTGGGK